MGGQAYAWACLASDFPSFLNLFISLVIQRYWGYLPALMLTSIFPIFAFIAVFFVKNEVKGIKVYEHEDKYQEIQEEEWY